MNMFYLGIDGGASKTAGVLCDQDGRVLARCRKGGSALSAQPSPEALAVINSVVKELLSSGSLPPDAYWHCGLGACGIDFADQIPGQIAAIRQAMELPADRLTIVNDGIIALWGATSAPRAAIIQHGSGLTSAYRCAMGQEQLFDCLDESGLFDLRQEAVRTVSRMIDGRCRPSILKDHLLRHWNVRHEEQFTELVYRGMIPWQRLWSSVPTIFQCWLAGDWASAILVRQAAEDYARMAKAMLACVGGQGEVAFGGGVIQQAPPRFWHLLDAELGLFAPGSTLRKPALPPEYGAAVLACHQAGTPAGDLFARLESQVKE